MDQDTVWSRPKRFERSRTSSEQILEIISRHLSSFSFSSPYAERASMTNEKICQIWNAVPQSAGIWDYKEKLQEKETITELRRVLSSSTLLLKTFLTSYAVSRKGESFANSCFPYGQFLEVRCFGRSLHFPFGRVRTIFTVKAIKSRVEKLILQTSCIETSIFVR